MTSPSNKNTKDDVEALMNARRAYTTGGKLGARQMFTFDENGNISGLKKVEPKSKQEDQMSHKSGG